MKDWILMFYGLPLFPKVLLSICVVLVSIVALYVLWWPIFSTEPVATKGDGAAAASGPGFVVTDRANIGSMKMGNFNYRGPGTAMQLGGNIGDLQQGNVTIDNTAQDNFVSFDSLDMTPGKHFVPIKGLEHLIEMIEGNEPLKQSDGSYKFVSIFRVDISGRVPAAIQLITSLAGLKSFAAFQDSIRILPYGKNSQHNEALIMLTPPFGTYRVEVVTEHRPAANPVGLALRE